MDEGFCLAAAPFGCVLRGLAKVSLLMLPISFPCIVFPLNWHRMSGLHRKGLAESFVTTKRALQSLFYVGCYCWVLCFLSSCLVIYSFLILLHIQLKSLSAPPFSPSPIYLSVTCYRPCISAITIVSISYFPLH